MAAPHSQSVPAMHVYLAYDDPVKMEDDEADPPKEKSMEWLKFWLFRTSTERFIPDPRLVNYVSEHKKCMKKVVPEQKDAWHFLETLFPTKYWSDNGERWKQKVSKTQATRPALKSIYSKLESEMERRQANKINPDVPSYCPIRYTLHMELFDELIRQCTLECRFRGYLLNRVRGELCQTLDSYKSLLSISLVEDSRMESQDMVDPETVSLRTKLDTLEGELQELQTERSSVGCDYKELCDKMDLLDRIRTGLHDPQVAFLKKLAHAMERQQYHFENPPSFEEEELPQVLNI